MCCADGDGDGSRDGVFANDPNCCCCCCWCWCCDVRQGQSEHPWWRHWSTLTVAIELLNELSAHWTLISRRTQWVFSTRACFTYHVLRCRYFLCSFSFAQWAAATAAATRQTRRRRRRRRRRRQQQQTDTTSSAERKRKTDCGELADANLNCYWLCFWFC